jgi:arylsulfatase A-like enzyme
VIDHGVGVLALPGDPADLVPDVYSTDTGPHYNAWPDGAISPWRSEKNSNWECAYRVPCFMRWPGRFPAGTTLTGIMTHQEWLPTLLAAAGEPDIVARLKHGHQSGEKSFRVHIDG